MRNIRKASFDLALVFRTPEPATIRTSCLAAGSLTGIAHDIIQGQHGIIETWRGKNIGDVLQMEVDEAVDFFAAMPVIAHLLQLLKDVGLPAACRAVKSASSRPARKFFFTYPTPFSTRPFSQPLRTLQALISKPQWREKSRYPVKRSNSTERCHATGANLRNKQQHLSKNLNNWHVHNSTTLHKAATTPRHQIDRRYKPH